jgi:hypothetical protein
MAYRQFDLREFPATSMEDGGARLVVWLDDERGLKVGTRVTLKETGDMQWLVYERYSTLRNHDQLLEGRRWKVGGLK